MVRTYIGKPSSIFQINSMICKYGMTYDESTNKAIYDDNCTLIFCNGEKYPYIGYGILSISQDDIVNSGIELSSITDVKYARCTVSIEQCAFANCVNLSSVSGPTINNLLMIGQDAFKNCSSLRKIEIDECNMISCYDTAFNGCNEVEIIDPFLSTYYDKTTNNLMQEDKDYVDAIKSKIEDNHKQSFLSLSYFKRLFKSTTKNDKIFEDNVMFESGVVKRIIGRKKEDYEPIKAESQNSVCHGLGFCIDQKKQFYRKAQDWHEIHKHVIIEEQNLDDPYGNFIKKCKNCGTKIYD